MKNFSELLATNFSIYITCLVESENLDQVTVLVNDRQLSSCGQRFCCKIDLLDPIDIKVLHAGAYVKSLKFDGWECRPQYGEETPGLWKFSTNGLAFYQWQHHATGQGWLLNPQ